ncbi:TPA: head maturation protease, ClpP-related [Streptococcus pyogenes]|uniref:head maturation protease, ClpP-related n=1 Tax=Streptococcus pyogenes TaxID=1314 RepID=UPI00109CB440|nr:head maturation protease, ClpP-related [Streptococcus pyogenes]QCK28115.1 Clp protease ClpP [Streptococcus pyogenes]VGQ61206.1 Prophage Clp protease-like protein [Streptococcus pyogenes]VHA63595.1 ATP-dependent Clp protease, protease subunit [Streptococcus pyogenes]VHB01915.1 ATP-dependent Clp protease, protease subunit [Streptococcus pyogenes]VHB48976.1 ATP-dependent Clp protease, protease subunit [Streptococcus pyogenes]
MTKNIFLSIPKRIEASSQADGTAKLYLAGTVGAWYDGITFKEVRQAMSEISSDTVEVHINSYGGDMFEGIAIKNYLKQLDKTVIVVIDGIAASAASVIAMAGDAIKMPKDTQIMIHNPWTWAAGNAKELRKIADDLEKSQTSIEESYLAHFKGTRDELKALLDEETSLTAEEAVMLGLADELIEETDVVSKDELISDSEASVRENLIAKYGTEIMSEQSENESVQTTKGLERFAKLFR